MFGKCVWFCGVQRSYVITDEALLEPVQRLLHPVLAAARHPCHVRPDNLRVLAAKPHLLSVNPSGRRCHLIVTRVAGVATAVLHEQRRPSASAKSTGAPAARAMTVPLRFHSSVYDRHPVIACTMNDASRTLVLDDLLAMDGGLLEHAHLNARAGALHDFVHNLYRPDAHLLPLTLETRRHFSFAQFTDVVRFAQQLPYAAHAISLRPMMLCHRELVAPLRPGRPAPSQQATEQPKRPAAGAIVDDVRVVRGDAPDLFHVQHAACPGLLTVRTLADSRALAAVFRDAPCVTLSLRYGPGEGEWARSER